MQEFLQLANNVSQASVVQLALFTSIIMAFILGVVCIVLWKLASAISKLSVYQTSKLEEDQRQSTAIERLAETTHLMAESHRHEVTLIEESLKKSKSSDDAIHNLSSAFTVFDTGFDERLKKQLSDFISNYKQRQDEFEVETKKNMEVLLSGMREIRLALSAKNSREKRELANRINRMDRTMQKIIETQKQEKEHAQKLELLIKSLEKVGSVSLLMFMRCSVALNRKKH